jgi:ABC-2 type transport system permease protein
LDKNMEDIMRNTGIKVHMVLLRTVLWKNLLELKRYPLEIVFSVIMPLAWFLPSYLLIISFAPNGQSSGLASWIGTDNFFSFYMIGVVVSFFIYTIFWDMGFALKRLMDFGLLETIWVCPIKKVIYIIGESMFSMISLIYQITVALILFRFVFKMALPPGFITSLPYFIPFIALMYGFGIAFAALVLLIKDANNVIDTSSFLVSTMTGSQNPLQVFPKMFLIVSLAIPITYFMDIIRVLSLKIMPVIDIRIEIAVFILTAIAFPFLGVKFFNFIDRKCRRDGTIHTH